MCQDTVTFLYFMIMLQLNTFELVKQFLKRKKVSFVLPHPSYSLDLAPCEISLFPKLKKVPTGPCYKSWQALVSAVSQCLRIYLHQCTVTHFRTEFINLYCVFQEFIVNFTIWVECFWCIEKHILQIEQLLYILILIYKIHMQSNSTFKTTNISIGFYQANKYF